MTTYWQIACGDGTVDLEDVFIKLNVALIGPGHLGDFFDHRSAYLALSDGHLIRTFCEDVSIDDIFVLKRMVNPRIHEWQIQAVGTVVSPYRFEPVFKSVDVSQWDMQHCRRVAWVVPPSRLVVTGGGAPIRIQKLNPDNPLVRHADDVMRVG